MRALIAIPIVIAILLLILFLPVFIAAFNVIISIKEAMAITRIEGPIVFRSTPLTK